MKKAVKIIITLVFLIVGLLALTYFRIHGIHFLGLNVSAEEVNIFVDSMGTYLYSAYVAILLFCIWGFWIGKAIRKKDKWKDSNVSHKIDKAKRLLKNILVLRLEIELNTGALQYLPVRESKKAAKRRFKRLQRKLEKATKRYRKYADENLKVSDLAKVYNKDSEDIEELYE